MTAQPQWIATLPDGSEVLISFWGGVEADPEVAPSAGPSRWDAPLDVRRVP